jgi:hypothetical protein
MRRLIEVLRDLGDAEGLHARRRCAGAVLGWGFKCGKKKRAARFGNSPLSRGRGPMLLASKMKKGLGYPENRWVILDST